MRRLQEKLPAYMKARSGSSFESRIEQDIEDAKARKKRSEVLEVLKNLKLTGGKSYTKRADAEKDLPDLWVKNPEDAGGNNDLAVALAWVEQWDDALKAINAAIEAAKSANEKKRPEANKEHIEKARKAARA